LNGFEGAAILAPTHSAAIDAFVISSFSERPIWWFIKEEVMKLPILGEALGWTGGISIRRGSVSHQAMSAAYTLLRDGHVLGIFPEGTRQSRDLACDKLEMGTARLAVWAEVPIIPCGIDSLGWSARRKRRPCAVVFGEPIYPEAHQNGPADYADVSRRLQLELSHLDDLAREAVELEYPAMLSDGSERAKLPRVKRIKRVGGPTRVSGHPRYARERPKVRTPAIAVDAVADDDQHASIGVR
jgi:1-acyl-sn-glycerol-3-phosphate acyltransferase